MSISSCINIRSISSDLEDSFQLSCNLKIKESGDKEFVT